VLLATYDLWGFVSENRHELWHGLVNTIKVSAIAIVGSYAIGITLGAAPPTDRSKPIHRRLRRGDPVHPILVQIFLLFYALPQVGILLSQFDGVGGRDDLGWRVHSENFRAGSSPSRTPPGSRVGSRLSAAGDVHQRGAPDRRRIALPSSINTAISVVKNTR
jgi:ABC-type amino acid transport system permease subunit